MRNEVQARRVTITGRAQGVGFRPFLYRLAHACAVTGWVRNDAGRVEAHVEGAPAAVQRFVERIVAEAPPLARPRVDGSGAVPAEGHDEFRIVPSREGDPSDAHLPPDQFACDDCLAEMADPAARRHRYPFINCTQCGPRYTIIERLPYDRPNTAMAGFPLCPDCRREYEDPLDRRFDAQPLACPVCGPHLSFRSAAGEWVDETEGALAACVAALRTGHVVAVKGIGGYHLMCDATDPEAVGRLRDHKPRPDKPLAVMVAMAGPDGLEAVRRVAEPTPEEVDLLRDPMRPIVLARRRSDSPLAETIAPSLTEVGLMLPYSPLHHLLLRELGGPLVATSGNVSGEPVLTAEGEIEARLGHAVDAFLHHDRPILRPADDALYRRVAGAMRPLRLGRGCAPAEVALPVALPAPLLAVGGQMKNTVALAWGRRVVVSPHIGELDTPRGLAIFEQVVEDLQALYGVKALRLACDAHPHYTASQWARSRDLPVTEVFHHHAHAAALAGEHRIAEPMLVFTWDGVGYGEDRTLWGGEALLGRPGQWQRVASFRPFRLPGGDRAGREPWRSAAALCWEVGRSWGGGGDEMGLLRQAWWRSVNSPVTTAAGRLFDAAAALTGLCHAGSFEGQGPMWLEAAAGGAARAIPLPLECDAHDVWRSDWEPLLSMLLDEELPVAERAAIFHASLVDALVDQAVRVRKETRVARVGLTGGCFQNRILTEGAVARLEAAGFQVLLHAQVPCNDAGIGYGQVVEAAARLR
ncbi:MAG: carbamoyltransferase HypF [Nitrospirota bacterium]|jgi:hydrogenase maturation protein HypF